MAQTMYELSDLDPQARPTQLEVEDIDKLVSAYKCLLEKYPDIGLYEYRASRRIVSLSKARHIQVTECTE